MVRLYTIVILSILLISNVFADDSSEFLSVFNDKEDIKTLVITSTKNEDNNTIILANFNNTNTNNWNITELIFNILTYDFNKYNDLKNYTVYKTTVSISKALEDSLLALKTSIDAKDRLSNKCIKSPPHLSLNNKTNIKLSATCFFTIKKKYSKPFEF